MRRRFVSRSRLLVGFELIDAGDDPSEDVVEFFFGVLARERLFVMRAAILFIVPAHARGNFRRAHQQSQVRAQLAFVLEGVVTQTLVPKRSGKGRIAATEILVTTQAIRSMIRDDKIHQIYSAMQAGKKYGMQTLNDALYSLYMRDEVALEECMRLSADPVEFRRMVGGEVEEPVTA